jgi:putative redox protein
MPTITADLSDGYVVLLGNGTHEWTADEPSDIGGTDTGPTPYELLLGALGACTVITISMYAKRKGISVDHVSARYTYDKVHADDCDLCEEDAIGWLDRVTAQIFIDGEFTDEQRVRLSEIAQRCPVHKTLEKGIHFEEEVIVG